MLNRQVLLRFYLRIVLMHGRLPPFPGSGSNSEFTCYKTIYILIFQALPTGMFGKIPFLCRSKYNLQAI